MTLPKELCRIFFETNSDAILVFHHEQIIHANASAAVMFGSSLETLIGQTWQVLSPTTQPDGSESVAALADRLAQVTPEAPYSFEWQCCRKDNQCFYAQISISTAVSAGETYLQAIIRDISVYKEAQLSLVDSEQRYQTLFENVPVAIFTKDRDGVYTSANPDTLQYWDRSPVGHTDMELLDAAVGQVLREHDLMVMESGREFVLEEQITTPTGLKTVLSRKVPVRDTEDQITGILGISIDITERKQLEDQIQQMLELRSRQFQTITAITQEIVTAPALDQLFRLAVNLVQETFHYYHVHIYTLAHDQLVLQEGTGEAARLMKSAGHKIPLDHPESLVARAARHGEPILMVDTSSDAKWLPNPHLPETKSEIAVPIRVGETVLGVLDVQNNTAGSLGEEDKILLLGLCGQIGSALVSTRLLEESAIFRQFVEASSQGIGFASLEGEMVYINPIFGQMLGESTPAALVGRPIFPYFPDEALHRLREEVIPTVMRKGEWSGELELRTANGKRVPAIQSYFLILDQHHQPRYLANITTDITERKQAELELSEQLRELNALQNTLRREGWRTFKPALAEGYFFDQIDLESLPSEWATSLQETVLDTGAERITLHPDEQSVVLAPLSTYDEALGVLGLHEDPENPLSADEMALVEAISEQVSLALENARLVEQTQAAVAENERLYRGSGRVISATTIDQILTALIDSTILNELDQAGILLFDRPLAAGEKPESFEVVAFWECQSNPLRQFMPTHERLDDFPAHYFMGRDDGPYLVVDTETEPSLEAEDRQYLTAQLGVRSLAVWPLVVGESWFGALSAQSSRPFQIRVEAIRQVNSLVDQAATTIQNRRLFRQTQEALSETEMLYEFSQELMTTTNLDQVLQVAAGPSIDRGANRITLISFEQGSTGQLEWAQIEAAWAEQQDVSDTVGTRWYLADHLLSRFWLADPDHPRLIGDIENEPGLTEVVRHHFREEGVRAIVVVPLRFGGRWIGVLTIAWPHPVVFSSRDRRLYQALLSQTAAAVENRRLIDRTQEALALAEATQRRYTLRAWENYRAGQASLLQINTNANQDAANSPQPAELKRALNTKQPVIFGKAVAHDEAESDLERFAVGNDSPGFPATATDPVSGTTQTGAGLLVPLVVRGEVIGLIEICDQAGRHTWLPEEITLVEAIARQMAQTAESLRLVDESQQRAARESRVNQIGEKIHAAQSLEEALQIAVKEVGLSLKAPRTLVRLSLGE